MNRAFNRPGSGLYGSHQESFIDRENGLVTRLNAGNHRLIYFIWTVFRAAEAYFVRNNLDSCIKSLNDKLIIELFFKYLLNIIWRASLARYDTTILKLHN